MSDISDEIAKLAAAEVDRQLSMQRENKDVIALGQTHIGTFTEFPEYFFPFYVNHAFDSYRKNCAETEAVFKSWAIKIEKIEKAARALRSLLNFDEKGPEIERLLRNLGSKGDINFLTDPSDTPTEVLKGIKFVEKLSKELDRLSVSSSSTAGELKGIQTLGLVDRRTYDLDTLSNPDPKGAWGGKRRSGSTPKGQLLEDLIAIYVGFRGGFSTGGPHVPCDHALRRFVRDALHLVSPGFEKEETTTNASIRDAHGRRMLKPVYPLVSRHVSFELKMEDEPAFDYFLLELKFGVSRRD